MSFLNDTFIEDDIEDPKICSPEALMKQMQQTRNTLEKMQQETIKEFLEILLSPEQYDKVKDTVDDYTILLLPITLYSDLGINDNPVHFIQGSSLLTNEIIVTKKPTMGIHYDPKQ